MNRRIALTLAAGAAFLPAVAVAQNTDEAPTDDGAETAPTVAALIATMPDLATLAAMLNTADMAATLEGEGPFTVFAPTNAAFEKLGEPRLLELSETGNEARLKRVLGHHVVAERLAAADLSAGTPLDTLAESKLVITEGDALLVGGAKLLDPDLEAANGILHLIDTVLVPTEA